MRYSEMCETLGHGSVPSESKRNCRWWAGLLAIAVCCVAPGCSLRQEKFSTPEDAAKALILAAQSDQKDEVKKILGKGADDVTSSGDEIKDQLGRDKFLKAYDEKHELVAQPDGSVTLQVGADDWPMPIPIVKRWGSWRFDTTRGRDEILNRRIGRNELDAVQVCLAVVDAQREYAEKDRNGDGVLEYAKKFFSDPGEKNGLYWETSADEPPSPLGELAADASEEGYSTEATQTGAPRPYHGYLFKMLTAQGPNAPGGARDYMVDGKMTGGFAVVAWPAEYGNSGVMTFMVNNQGVVYQQNLGRKTARIASSMSAFNPDLHWILE